MLRRIGRLALATAAAVTLTQAPIAVTPAANAAVCDLVTVPFAGTYTGSTGTISWYQWHTTAAAGQTTIEASADDYYSLVAVYDSNCVEHCWSSYAFSHYCTIDTIGTVNVFVGHQYGYPMTYTLTATPGTPTVPAECADGIDNDLNGTSDYPSDPGCSGPDDNQEQSPPQACTPIANLPTCVAIQHGTIYQTVTAYGPRTVVDATHSVVGTLDVYRFALPTGGAVTAPCVVLTANTAGSNACATAGGTFVTRLATLVDRTVEQPGARVDVALATVRICHATYTVTVAAIGIEQFPAYSVC